MRRLCSALLAVFVISCVPQEYPSDDPIYSDLRSFRAPPLENIEGDSFRLVWHAWHMFPGLITANCGKTCTIELRHTDGYGTYSQGKLAGRHKREILRREFDAIASNFRKRNFNAFISDHSEEEDECVREESDPPGMCEIRICLHAPHYYLESRVKGEYHVIFRYCHEDYLRDLEVAFPLIDLAEKYFPDQIGQVKAQWIEEYRAERGI